MKRLLSDAVLSALANPAAAELEVLQSDESVVGTANMMEQAIAASGATLLLREAETSPTSAFTPPRWESLVFRASPSSGYARTRDHFLLVPAIRAVIEREPSGEVWITFDLADSRLDADHTPMAA